MNERVEQLKDITFSEWQPKDKYWLLTMVEAQEGEIEAHLEYQRILKSQLTAAKESGLHWFNKLAAANAEIERLLREGRKTCDAWNEELTAEREKVERLRDMLEQVEYINENCCWCCATIKEGHFDDCQRKQALADTEEGKDGN